MANTVKTRKTRPLVNGHPIHFRRTQQLNWTVLSILLGSGFFAGLYWFILQQHYPFMPGSGSLKLWWDNGMGFIHSGNWAAYRHGVRDGGEPAAWTLIGATILGKVKTSGRILSLGWLAPAALLLLALIIAGTVGITWLTNFGPLSKMSDVLSWQQIILGVILGRVLHLLWNPIGNTVRYHIIATAALRPGVPLWVKLPLLPPTWRETWAELKANPTAIRAVRQTLQTSKSRNRHMLRWVIPVIVIGFVFVAVVGNLAKYGVAHGAHIPGMN